MGSSGFVAAAVALSMAAPAAAEPRILESATRLAAEMQLEQADPCPTPDECNNRRRRRGWRPGGLFWGICTAAVLAAVVGGMVSGDTPRPQPYDPLLPPQPAP